MHICQDEIMAFLAMLPFAPYVISKLKAATIYLSTHGGRRGQGRVHEKKTI